MAAAGVSGSTSRRPGAAGRVFWVSDDGTSADAWPQAAIDYLDSATLFRRIHEDHGRGQERPAACVLEGVLDHLPDPAAALAWAYRVLPLGGVLAVSVKDVRQASQARLASLRAGDATLASLFPGETLPALLFRSGFEAPRLRSKNGDLVVTARRSALAPPLQRTQRLSVIMPVYNEVATFQATIDALLAKTIPGIEIEVILVESNSTDGTREKALDYACHPRVHLILEERPQGKGHAVRAGLALASGDFVLIQDADMEYDLDDYGRLLEPLRAGEVGFVLGMRTSPEGSRGLRDFGQMGLTSRIMNLGHVLFLILFNTVYGQRLQDPFTMYKVIRRDCLHGLTFECDRFDFDWELTAKLVRAGYLPREIPVAYRSRSFKEGKKVSFFKDPLTWVRACFKYRFVDLYPERSPAADDDHGDGSTPGLSGTPLSSVSEKGNVELPVDATYPAEVGIRAE